MVLAVLPPFRLRGFLIRTGLLDGFCGDVEGQKESEVCNIGRPLEAEAETYLLLRFHIG
jgi:hypothetical protein